MAGRLTARPPDPARRAVPALIHKILLPLLVAAGLAGVLTGAGCAEEGGPPDFSNAEKIGYIARSASNASIRVTAAGGGEGQSLLEWTGEGERFSFSNDGRYFALILRRTDGPGAEQEGGNYHYLIAASDGSSAHLSGRATLFAFSPDSSRAAYVTLPVSGANELGLIDLRTWEKKALVRGSVLINPTWTDDRTLVYTELTGSTLLTNQQGGIVYRLDVDSLVATALTPAGRSFSSYHAPVSFPRARIVLTERGPHYNLWSLDVGSGRLRQITNNRFYHFRAGYLPDGGMILFERQRTPEDTMSSELCLIADDGSEFRQLTGNFFFDGLSTFSPETGRIAYQQVNDEKKTSIWTVRQDGTEAAMVAEAKTGWLGDPGFIPASAWREANPLEMTVGESAPDGSRTVTVSNPSQSPVEATLKAFSGPDLELAPAEGSLEAAREAPADAGSETSGPDTGSARAQLEWNLRLGPGETREVGILAEVRPTFAPPGEATLLITLAVEGTPPRMFWQDLG